MVLLNEQIPMLYWLLRTLWEVLVTASTSLLIFLCIAFFVLLYQRAKQG